MSKIRSSGRRRVSLRYFFAISIASLVLGLLAGMTNAQQPEQHPRYEFADGRKAFCADAGRISLGHTDFEVNSTDGFLTPERAVGNYLAKLYRAASGANAPSGEELPSALFQLLEPSRRFRPTERQEISPNLIYFNLLSSKKGLLEARIVVEHIGSGFGVTETYICEAQLVSDPVKFERLWAEEVKKHANP